MWCAVGVALERNVAFERNGGHGDARAFGKPLVQIAISRLAFGQAAPRMNLVEATGLTPEEFAKMRKGVVSLRNNLIRAAQGER